MTRRISLILLLLVTTMPAQLPTPIPDVSQDSSPVLSYIYSNKVRGAGSVDELSLILDEAFATHFSVDDDAVPDLYGKAKGYLTTSKPVLAKLKKKPAGNAIFSACSLSTLAAVMQLVQARYDRDLRLIYQQRNDVQQQIRSARDRICELRSGKTSGGVDRKFSAMQSRQIQVGSDSRGTVISVSDILFKTDSAGITHELAASLTRFAEILLSSSNYRVIIEGHTDNRGPEDYNQILSEKRAQNVLTFLVGRGVAPDRLSAKGFGMSRPIDTNETSEGRKRNRRVDLVVQEVKMSAGDDASVDSEGVK
ncbi:MAG: OmpA family protein [Chitinispirillaceae bacterium]|nr:OmpA family protein [Chitinispirillaceae bacterium]